MLTKKEDYQMTKAKPDKLVKTLKMHNNYDVLPFRNLTKLERDLALYILSRLSHTKPLPGYVPKVVATIITYEDVRRELNLPKSYRPAELIEFIDRTTDKVRPFKYGSKKASVFAYFNMMETSFFVGLEPYSYQMFSDFKDNFSQYELPKLYSLKSRYAVALYILVWRYRSTGWLTIRLDNLKQQMQIPDSYDMARITDKVLRPAIKELEDKAIVKFYRTEGKLYEPIKNEALGRSHTVAIRLRFKKDYLAFINANNNKKDDNVTAKTKAIIEAMFGPAPDTKDS